MISQISGEPLKFIGQLLLVDDSQRKALEAVLQECGCVGSWSPSVYHIQKYSDSSQPNEDEVAIWSLYVPKVEDAENAQRALDAIDA